MLTYIFLLGWIPSLILPNVSSADQAGEELIFKSVTTPAAFNR